MSSSDDSETAEWEREQMLRGTQSRGRHQNTSQQADPQKSEKGSDRIDATVAKLHVNRDIERVEGEIEAIKRNIGSTRLDIVKSDKRIIAIRKRIEILESSNSFFHELATLSESGNVLECLEKNRSIITQLPPDQKEMVDLLEKTLKESPSPMEIDNQ